MRLEKVDLNLFVVFDAIYRERSVTKVAVLLSLTQPAVSNALNRLRQTFDDPLFIRTSDGMTPTPVAENVVQDVRNALELLGKSVGVNAHFNPEKSEKLFRLGLNDLAESLLLPSLRSAMKMLAPNVSVSSYYETRELATEELKSGALDLLLDTPLVKSKGLAQARLGEFDYVIAMRPNHPLAGEPLTVAQYLSCEHVHVSSRKKGRGQMDVALHGLGYRRKVMMRVQSYLVAGRITEETDLLWTVPQVMANMLPLHRVSLPFSIEPVALNLYWSKSADNDPASQWMRSVFIDVAKRKFQG